MGEKRSMYGTNYKTYGISTDRGDETIRFVVSRYRGGGEGLYVGVENLTEDGWDAYADVTTNVERVPFVTLDVGHIDKEAADTYLAPVIDLMEREGLIERSHMTVSRGFKRYETVRFPVEILTKGLVIDDRLARDPRLDGTYFDTEDVDWRISEELGRSLDDARRDEAAGDSNDAPAGTGRARARAKRPAKGPSKPTRRQVPRARGSFER